MAAPIKVLIADDSSLMRTLLSDLLTIDGSIQVVGTAHDGIAAIEMVSQLHPDVLVMDVQMPRLSGLEALRQIMDRHPLPVVIISGLDNSDFVTQAFQLGAVDAISKPSGTVSVDIYKTQEELISKVEAAAQADVNSLLASALPLRPEAIPIPLSSARPNQGEVRCLVLIAASTGGPRTLEQLLYPIPPDIPAAILVVQHMPAEFTRTFADRLNQRCALLIKEAEEGDTLMAGRAYVAPGGFHMLLHGSPEDGTLAIHLDSSPPVSSLRPRADLTMTDAVRVFGNRCLGIVLTGMGDDGTAGLQLIREAGGATIAQDEATSTIYGMPRAAVENGAVQLILPIHKIPLEVARWCAKWGKAAPSTAATDRHKPGRPK